MNKVSTADIVEVLADAARTSREARDEIRELKQKLAAYETSDRAEVLLDKMIGLGHHVEGETRKQKVANLLTSGRDLGVLEAAVDLSPPNGNTFSVGDEASGNAAADLEAAILGG